MVKVNRKRTLIRRAKRQAEKVLGILNPDKYLVCAQKPKDRYLISRGGLADVDLSVPLGIQSNPQYRHKVTDQIQPDADLNSVSRLREADERMNTFVADVNKRATAGMKGLPPDLRSASQAQNMVTKILTDDNLKRQVLAKVYKDHPTIRFALEHHRNTFGAKLSFDTRPWLKELYYFDFRKKRYRRLVIQKSVQCGVTEWLIVTVFVFAELGLSILYVLPNREFRAKFVSNRINRALGEVSYYKQMLAESRNVRGTDKVNLKHIGNATQYFASAGSENEFKEFPCDAVFVDESDQCNPANVALAEDRFSASDWKISIKVSNPTHVSFGICRAFTESTQGRWMVRCDHCPPGQGWQELGWWTHFVRDEEDGTCEARQRGYDPLETEDEPEIYCVKCHRPLDPLGTGAWVHSYPNRAEIGLKISKLFQGPPMTTSRELMLKYFKVRNNTTELTKFINSDLGEGYAPKGQSITLELLEKNKGVHQMGADLPIQNFRTMGVDVGSLLNYTICDYPAGGYVRVLAAGAVATFDQLQKILDDYNPDVCAIDTRPEYRKVKEFRENNRCVYLADYWVNGKDLEIIENPGEVKIDRTMAIDAVAGRFTAKKYIIPADYHDYQGGEFRDQLISSYRVFIQGKKDGATDGSGKYQWQHSKPDHYLHTLVYNELARRVVQEGNFGSPGIVAATRSVPGRSVGRSQFGRKAKKLVVSNAVAKQVLRAELKKFDDLCRK